MKIGTTLRIFPETIGWQVCLQEAASAGFDGVEINFDGRFDIECPKNELSRLKVGLREIGVEASSVHSRLQWQAPINSSDPERRATGVRIVRRLIDIANYLEAGIVLTIPGVVDNRLFVHDFEVVDYDEAYKRSSEILADLVHYAEKANVTLAVENVANKMLLSPLEMKQFIEQFDSRYVGLYFDPANCLYLCGGYPEQWINILRDHLKAIHMKDYRTSVGTLAGFVDIFEGDMNWPALVRALAEVGYDGYLTSEVLPPLAFHPEELWRTSAARLTILRDEIRKHSATREGSRENR